MPLQTSVFTGLPYDIPCSDQHIASLTTGTAATEALTWPGAAFFFLSFPP